jgi:hypothetical protein
MRLFVSKVAVALLVALVTAVSASAATYRGYEPTTVSGYPRCSGLSGLTFTTEVKFSPLQHGANAGGIYVFFENNTLAWYTMCDVLVKAVILKGGAYSNVYRYPAFQDYSDSELVPPVKPKTGKRYAFDDATFCY